MAKKVCGGERKGVLAVLCIFTVLSLVISVERAVIDTFGQMWATLILNCLAIVFSIAGLLGICARDHVVFLIYSAWSVFSIGLNLVVILIYNDIGLLTQKEHYLGMVIGNGNFWKTNGLGCGQAINSSDDQGGSGMLIADGGYELLEEGEPQNSCTVPYSIVETVHAAVYMLIALVNFILCCCVLMCSKKGHRVSDYGNEDEEFSYVSVAQRFDFPHANRSQRHSYLDYW